MQDKYINKVKWKRKNVEEREKLKKLKNFIMNYRNEYQQEIK